MSELLYFEICMTFGVCANMGCMGSVVFLVIPLPCTKYEMSRDPTYEQNLPCSLIPVQVAVFTRTEINECR